MEAQARSPICPKFLYLRHHLKYKFDCIRLGFKLVPEKYPESIDGAGHQPSPVFLPFLGNPRPNPVLDFLEFLADLEGSFPGWEVAGENVLPSEVE